MTTRSAFHEQLSLLQRDVLRMGVFVNEAIDKAVRSLIKLDLRLAQSVVDQDDVADKMLIDLEKRSLQLMALQQPLAGDLRAIGTVLKIVTDLERMADHATDIARVTLKLEGETLFRELIDIPQMAQQVQEMTREALEAWVNKDVERARKMAAQDDRIDELYRMAFDDLLALMQNDPKRVRQATYLILVAMYLERVGDHATNLGEWTIYQATGELRDLNG